MVSTSKSPLCFFIFQGFTDSKPLLTTLVLSRSSSRKKQRPIFSCRTRVMSLATKTLVFLWSHPQGFSVNHQNIFFFCQCVIKNDSVHPEIFLSLDFISLMNCFGPNFPKSKDRIIFYFNMELYSTPIIKFLLPPQKMHNFLGTKKSPLVVETGIFNVPPNAPSPSNMTPACRKRRMSFRTLLSFTFRATRAMRMSWFLDIYVHDPVVSTFNVPPCCPDRVVSPFAGSEPVTDLGKRWVKDGCEYLQTGFSAFFAFRTNSSGFTSDLVFGPSPVKCALFRFRPISLLPLSSGSASLAVQAGADVLRSSLRVWFLQGLVYTYENTFR